MVALLGLRSALVVPLTLGPQILGLLLVGDRVGAVPFRDEDLGVLQAVAGQAAVSVENQRLHEQIKEANAQLQEYDRVKSEFVAIIAHDFRSPLMAIRGFAELVLEDADLPIESRQEFMQTIMDQTDDLARLANDTLLISRMETGNRGLYPDDIAAILGFLRAPADTRHELLTLVREGQERNWHEVHGKLPPTWKD